jgi:hypothetical protein
MCWPSAHRRHNPVNVAAPETDVLQCRVVERAQGVARGLRPGPTQDAGDRSAQPSSDRGSRCGNLGHGVLGIADRRNLNRAADRSHPITDNA